MLTKRSWKLLLRYCDSRPRDRRLIITPTFELMEKYSVYNSYALTERCDHSARAAEGVTQGGEKYMTSRDMYRHLNRLQELVPDYVRARPQIETILLRASAMLQGGGEMVLWTEAGTKPLLVPALESPGFWNLTGTLGHNAFLVGSAAEVPWAHYHTGRHYRQEPEGLFVAEAKIWDLWDCGPRVIAKLYASALKQKVMIVRGAISNGHKWAFVILRFKENEKEWEFMFSDEIPIRFERDYPNHVKNQGPDIVAGVLAYWIEHCYNDLDENDWFKYDKD